MSEEKEMKAETQTSSPDAFSIELTHQEIQALVSLLDIAVRAKGLDAATNAAVIHQKVIEAVSKQK